ncbi:primosomal protein N' [Streptococcus fryi]
MAKLASVIVDVPLMQTDKPFTYLIPQELEGDLTIGSRVHVPFGRSNRLVQGFVVGLTQGEAKDLKNVVSLLDAEPVLNAEQLYLADEMRHMVFSFKISLLKSMLPSLLNSSYDKEVSPTDLLSDEDRQSLFAGQSSLLLSRLTNQEQNEMMRFVRSGKVRLTYLAKDKKHLKTVKQYHVDRERLLNLEITSRAKKKLALKNYLLENSGSAPLSSLFSLFSREQVTYFIERGALIIDEITVNRSDTYFTNVQQTDFLTLNDEQQTVVNRVTAQIGQATIPFLLQGVTGSGKTEVYLHIIDDVLKKGKTAIVLVPEIALTPQMTHRFISRFGHQVAIMHSGLSDGEKYDEWRKIKLGQAKVVVGARSAIFAPLDNIGAIIIDEEHEVTYKQESNPRYHAREVALLRANYHKAILLLGSATPSLESRARASKGVYHFLELTKRANPNARLPHIEIIDFRQYLGKQEVSNFTPVLLDKIAERLKRREQIVLMLNKRGYSSFIMCRECSYVDRCSNCDISLTLHMDTKTMNCHYCGLVKPIPRQCPNCHSDSIRYYGTGTQKAYDELMSVFPEARVLRMDVDTTKQKGSHERLLEQFGRKEADILLGTQMIAKGLDFPDVTLVGVLNADTSIHLPDFRASERTFQLLMQVAGRAGRANKPGEVLIQTYNPNHYAIALAKKQDYNAFYNYEMGIRKMMGYPPYYFTVGLTLSHRNEEKVIQIAYQVLKMLKEHLSDSAQILGPTPKPIARTHNLYHYQILVKYRFEDQLEPVLNSILEMTQSSEYREIRLSIDHEPQQMM